MTFSKVILLAKSYNVSEEFEDTEVVISLYFLQNKTPLFVSVKKIGLCLSMRHKSQESRFFIAHTRQIGEVFYFKAPKFHYRYFRYLMSYTTVGVKLFSYFVEL